MTDTEETANNSALAISRQGTYTAPYPDDIRDRAFSLYIEYDGNLTRVAESLDISWNTAAEWKRQGDWQGRIDRAEKELTASAKRRVHRQLQDYAPQAIANLIHIAEHATDDIGHPLYSVRLRANNSLLDRAGYPAIQRMLIDQRTTSLSVHATLDPAKPLPTTEEATAILLDMMSEDVRER